MKSFILEKLRNSIKKEAVGVLIKAEDTNNVLLLLRNDKKPIWSLMSGGISGDETPMECLIREIQEELSIDATIIKFTKITSEDDGKIIFHYYTGLTSEEFIPKLDKENLKYGWFTKDNLPSPLFDGMLEKIQKHV